MLKKLIIIFVVGLLFQTTLYASLPVSVEDMLPSKELGLQQAKLFALKTSEDNFFYISLSDIEDFDPLGSQIPLRVPFTLQQIERIEAYSKSITSKMLDAIPLKMDTKELSPCYGVEKNIKILICRYINACQCAVDARHWIIKDFSDALAKMEEQKSFKELLDNNPQMDYAMQLCKALLLHQIWLRERDIKGANKLYKDDKKRLEAKNILLKLCIQDNKESATVKAWAALYLFETAFDFSWIYDYRPSTVSAEVLTWLQFATRQTTVERVKVRATFYLAKVAFENKQYKDAYDAFLFAAKQDIEPDIKALAAYQVAVCYHNGSGVERNIKEAVNWYSSASESATDKVMSVKGEAALALGIISGNVKNEEHKSLEYLEQACQDLDVHGIALYHLAQHYLKNKQYKEAYQPLERSIKCPLLTTAQRITGEFQLANLYRFGQTGEKRTAALRRHIRKAKDLYENVACQDIDTKIALQSKYEIALMHYDACNEYAKRSLVFHYFLLLSEQDINIEVKEAALKKIKEVQDEPFLTSAYYTANEVIKAAAATVLGMFRW